jgi:hypothetical protein
MLPEAQVTPRFGGDTKILRALTHRRHHKPFRREPTAKQFTHACRSRRHAFGETEIVDQRQLFRRKHDLQAFTAQTIGHGCDPPSLHRQEVRNVLVELAIWCMKVNGAI